MFEEQVRTGQLINNNIKFETLAKQWLQQVELEGNLKPLTINKYKQMQECTYKAIGHLKITEINRIHIQRFINSLTKDGVNQLTKGGLSTKSQKGYLGFVSNVEKRTTVFGNWTIEEKIGSGTFGTVYKIKRITALE